MGDRVWLDVNKNGVQDEGEPGMGNITVNLRTTGQDSPIVSTQTTPDGLYLFGNLQPGDYAVEFIGPGGYRWTVRNAGEAAADSDADPATGRAISTALTAGESDLTWDAGLVCEANGNLRGTVSAGGLASIPVLLTPVDVAGAPATMYPTAADGSYIFRNVTPGRYTLQVHDAFLNQRGYVPAEGSVKVIDVSVAGCQDQIVNFAYEKSPRGALGDFVWYDINANAIQDEWFDANNDGSVTKNALNADSIVPLDEYEWWDINGDGSHAGAENEGELRKCGLEVASADLLTLLKGNDLASVTAGQKTSIFGYYLFSNLDLRDWVVNFKSTDASLAAAAKAMFGSAKCKTLPGAPPAVDYPSAQQAGAGSGAMQVAGADAAPVSCGISTKITDLRTLTEAAPLYLEADFGILCADDMASLGDRVWLDENRNGLQNATESGIAGIVVQLHNVAGAVISTTVTNSQGQYHFSSLLPGVYAVSFSAPGGYVCTQSMAGADHAIDSDADCNTLRTPPVSLLAGETNLTLDAGFYMLNPTGVHLSIFEAKVVTGGVLVTWRTSLERNSFGFNVLRSVTGKRANATRVNAELLPAKGIDAGASYSLTDRGGMLNATYWLEEVELNGNVVDYEPVTASPAVVTIPKVPTPTPVAEWAKGAIPGGIPVVVAQAPANSVVNPPAQPQPVAQPVQSAPPAALQPLPNSVIAESGDAPTNAAGGAPGTVVEAAVAAAQPAIPPPQPAPAADAQPATAAYQDAPAVVQVAQGALNAVDVARSGPAAPAEYAPSGKRLLLLPSQAWFVSSLVMLGLLCITIGAGIYLHTMRRMRSRSPDATSEVWPPAQ